MSVRNTDPITSKLADLSVNKEELEQQILAALADGPLTSREIAQKLNREYVSVSPQLRPLARKGLVHEAGLKHNDTGKLAVSWALGGTPGGMGKVSTGPQPKPFKFKKYSGFNELFALLQPGMGAEAFIAKLNDDVLARIS
jgi:hypothetical protein